MHTVHQPPDSTPQTHYPPQTPPPVNPAGIYAFLAARGLPTWPWTP